MNRIEYAMIVVILHRLADLVVKASASGAEDPGFTIVCKSRECQQEVV